MSESDWHPKGFEAYAGSNYSYDDAALLAQLWNISVGEAKQAIGHKIIHGIEDLLPSKVAPDPKVSDHPPNDWDNKALDAFFKSGYTYEDAERLAQLWGQPDAYAGKKLIGGKILSGNTKLLEQLLKGPEVNENEKWLDAFFNSNYTYDDADLLAQLWGLGSAFEGKKLIGAKLVNGLENLLPDKLRRDSGGCGVDKINPDDKAYDAFFNSEYTYDDAELLARLWNISLGEAKKTIGNKVIHGIDQALPMDVRRPRG